jgi:ribose 5-phosphate isomerase B
MKIAIGCDPNSDDFKRQLIPYIRELGHEVLDYGSDDPIYANVAIAVASDVAAGKAHRGVLICGTGIGMSIAANKTPGAYAALVTDVYQARRAQLSNDANIMAMGAQVTGVELAKCLVKEYLANTYDPDSRSGPKVRRITEYEKNGA